MTTHEAPKAGMTEEALPEDSGKLYIEGVCPTCHDPMHFVEFEKDMGPPKLEDKVVCYGCEHEHKLSAFVNKYISTRPMPETNRGGGVERYDDEKLFAIRQLVCGVWQDAVKEFNIKPGSGLEKNIGPVLNAIDELRNQPQPSVDLEPIAWLYRDPSQFSLHSNKQNADEEKRKSGGTVDPLYLAPRLSGNGWRPIESAPDGKKVWTIKKIAMSDGYFEPDVLYRNGEYWFYEPGRRAPKPDFWQDYFPPAAPSTEGK